MMRWSFNCKPQQSSTRFLPAHRENLIIEHGIMDSCEDATINAESMHGSEDEDNDLLCSQEALTISYENNSGSMQKKNEMDAWLTEKLNYLKKPVEVSNAVSELAIMYRGSSTDKIKRGVSDWRRETIQWSRQQDADLVAFAFYYANVANSMRNLETYKRITENWKSGDPPEPKQLYYRLKHLCAERELQYLRKLAGAENYQNDQDKMRNLYDAVDRLRAAVLDVDDVYQNGLMKRIKLYVNEKPKQRERRPWIRDTRKLLILKKVGSEKDMACLETIDSD